jgi:hypothetical protein
VPAALGTTVLAGAAVAGVVLHRRRRSRGSLISDAVRKAI